MSAWLRLKKTLIAVIRLFGVLHIGPSRLKRCIGALIVSVVLAITLKLILSIPDAVQLARLSDAANAWHEATVAALPEGTTLRDVQTWAEANGEQCVFNHHMGRPQLRVLLGRELASGTTLTTPLWAGQTLKFDQYDAGFSRTGPDPNAKLLSTRLWIREEAFMGTKAYHRLRLIPRIPLFWLPIFPFLFFKGLRETIRLRRGVCLRCNYDLRGDHSKGCPECGWGRGDAPLKTRGALLSFRYYIDPRLPVTWKQRREIWYEAWRMWWRERSNRWLYACFVLLIPLAIGESVRIGLLGAGLGPIGSRFMGVLLFAVLLSTAFIVLQWKRFAPHVRQAASKLGYDVCPKCGTWLADPDCYALNCPGCGWEREAEKTE